MEKMEKIMTFIVATNVVASRQTGTPTTRAKRIVGCPMLGFKNVGGPSHLDLLKFYSTIS